MVVMKETPDSKLVLINRKTEVEAEIYGLFCYPLQAACASERSNGRL